MLEIADMLMVTGETLVPEAGDSESNERSCQGTRAARHYVRRALLRQASCHTAPPSSPSYRSSAKASLAFLIDARLGNVHSLIATNRSKRLGRHPILISGPSRATGWYQTAP